MVIILAAYTGMRRGEILGLKWEDVDFEYRILRVRRSLVPTKTGCKFQEPKTATPIPPSSVTHGFETVLKKAGLPKIRFHYLRHTHASLDTYSHVMPALHQEAAQRLDEFLPVRRPKRSAG